MQTRSEEIWDESVAARQKIDRAKDGMFAGSIPCNPKPFASALAEFGPTSIQSDEAKQILWVLLSQAYGQMAKVDLYDEYKRLDDARKQRENEDG